MGLMPAQRKVQLSDPTPTQTSSYLIAPDPEPTPHDRLQMLDWLVGDWVDEDAEAAISMACRWDQGGNFILTDSVGVRGH